MSLTQESNGLCLGAFNPPFAPAVRAFKVGTDTQGRFETLTAHFHQAELANAADRHLGFVILESFAQFLFNFTDVFSVPHVDKVDHDQAAKISESQLSTDFCCRFKVGFGRSRFNAAFTRHLS